MCIAFLGIIIFALATYKYIETLSKAPQFMSASLTPSSIQRFQNIALMGYGGGDHDGGALTDSIVVARIDDRTKKIFLVSVPRDIWVKLPFEDNIGRPAEVKINSAYAIGLDDYYFSKKPDKFDNKNGGGGKLAKYVLTEVVGEPISNFISVSFEAFRNFVDSLGGITITRNTSFTDEMYPIEGKERDTCGKTEEDITAIEATLSGQLKEKEYACRYETLTFGVGSLTLDGETALKYVRSRHSETEGGDFYRSQRQRQVILAIKEKILSLDGVVAIAGFATKISRYIDTDYDIGDIPTLIKYFMARRDYTIESVALTDKNTLDHWTGPNGEYALIPKSGKDRFDIIHKYLLDRYRGYSEASATARMEIRSEIGK
jgi:polyisoprenyl-teichoic acid--peptidoglycan teichoic acid transferase